MLDIVGSGSSSAGITNHNRKSTIKTLMLAFYEKKLRHGEREIADKHTLCGNTAYLAAVSSAS
jgi:hypothetical protein